MESIGLRERPLRKCRQRKQPHYGESHEELIPNFFANSSSAGQEPPKFTVDLSLPAEQRYLHIVPDMLPNFSGAQLEGLFNALVSDVAPWPAAAWLVRLLAHLALRRVHSDEETAELRGIARATKLPMYLLVAFNVLLDLLLGCTSGGVRVAEGTGDESRVLHFRTLDWAMDPLRQIVVELDFVRRPGGPVVATAVTYFGYVGVLTGVRDGLSMSLNFRPYHDRSTWRKRVGFRWHQLLVVLGWRPSISSVLRGYLIPPSGREDSDRATKPDDPNIQRIISNFSESASTSAYLVFCTPKAAYLVEKDNRSATVRMSTSFLSAYNHDFADEDDESALAAAARDLAEHEAGTGMSIIVESSLDRKRRADEVVREALGRRRRRRRGKAVRSGCETIMGMEDVLALVEDPYISNDETHYAVVMDPGGGKVLWRRVFIVGDL